MDSEVLRRNSVDEQASVARNCPSYSGFRVIKVRVIETHLYLVFLQVCLDNSDTYDLDSATTRTLLLLPTGPSYRGTPAYLNNTHAVCQLGQLFIA